MVTEPKRNPEVLVPSKAPFVPSISSPPPMAHSKLDLKGKAPTGSSGAWAKLLINPRAKLPLKWRAKMGSGFFYSEPDLDEGPGCSFSSTLRTYRAAQQSLPLIVNLRQEWLQRANH